MPRAFVMQRASVSDSFRQGIRMVSSQVSCEAVEGVRWGVRVVVDMVREFAPAKGRCEHGCTLTRHALRADLSRERAR